MQVILYNISYKKSEYKYDFGGNIALVFSKKKFFFKAFLYDY